MLVSYIYIYLTQLTDSCLCVFSINLVRLENDIDDLARRLRTDTETLTSLTEKLRQRRSSEYCQT